MTPKNRVLLYIVGILIIMISSSFIFPRYGTKTASSNKQIKVEDNNPVIEQTFEVNSNPFEENQELYTLNAEIPSISGKIDPTKQDQVNLFIQQEANSIVSDFKKNIPSKLIDNTQSSLEIGFETIYFSESLVSIKLNISEYKSGESNLDVSTKMLNFDIDNSKEIFLEDIFNKDSQYLFFLSTYSAQQLLNSYAQVGEDIINFIKNITSSKEENFQTFGFDKESFIIYFQTDEIGSLVLGPEEVKILVDQNMLAYVNQGPVKNLWEGI